MQLYTRRYPCYRHLLFIIFINIFVQPALPSSIVNEKFIYFTDIDGLPRNITTCLEQDQYGYLWVGTANGIARFDGKNFYSYKELSGINVINILYDTRNTLWVATNKGIYRYNRQTNFFELIIQGYISKIKEDKGEIYFLMVSNIYKVADDKAHIMNTNNEVSDFCFSKNGLWISKTNNAGLILYSRESNFTRIIAKHLTNKSIALINDIDNRLFVGCYDGELYSIPDKGAPIQIEINNHSYYEKIVKVGQEIWLATDGNGIIILDKNFHFSRILNKGKSSNASINSNSIRDILPRNNNEIWIATFGAGLTCILPDNALFQNITPEKGNENSLVANEGLSIFIKKPFMYLGTNYGLSTWNESTKQFKNLPFEKLKKDLNGAKVTALNVDENYTLWVGTYDGLLGKYSMNYKFIKAYHPSSSTSNEMQQIILLRKVSEHNLLILTQYHDRILLNFDTEKETTSLFELYSKGSKITYCLLNALRENQQGELLAIISDKGLFHVNWKENILENKLTEINKHIDCFVVDFYQDKKGDYWFASLSGLLYVSKDGKTAKKYTVKEGLPSNSLVRIESVDDRFLWISTIAGICRFDTENEQVLNFKYSDGLPANEFYDRASAKTNDGRIIFGSLAGFTIVNPSKVNNDATKTEVAISDIIFQNQSIRSPEGVQFLKEPLEETKELWLPFNKNSFSIHFFAKNKGLEKYHNYTYRLKGLEKNWTYLIETNYATYTNLSPGTYTFEIKTANKTDEGVLTHLIIHIQSPWYLSWYAYITYVMLFLAMIYLSVYAYLKKLELRKEKEISEFKIQKEHELTDKKLEFFTNISHDLKTPLTLIETPVNDLLQSGNLNTEQVNKLMLISRNSKRLYKLITDLLDFNKINQKQHILEVKEVLISDILTDILEAFKEECINKSIRLKCSVEDNLVGFIDKEKIEKILWNLLSNALKFTPKGGSISLSAEEQIGTQSLILAVSDSGIGISESEKDKIFNRFYKITNTKSRNTEGTGIGLSIVKELVEMHHGKIVVESTLGKGTVFTVIIPSKKDNYSEDELDSSESKLYKKEDKNEIKVIENNAINNAGQKRYNLPTILIVEDNQDLREYLVEHFEKNYKVYQAEDGFDGLQTAKEINPDIILTDVQMPEMDGYEFCKEIRNSFDTSHIPVVMLTAYSATEQQIKGLATGADAYVSKPFDIKLLDTVLNSILENRRKLRHKFLGVETVENIEKSLPQKDIDFIQELKNFIEENMLNQELNVELLSSHFTVSLTQLNRKIKSLTGSTPNNFIKSIRLKKAYKLLREDGARVSEVAYLTGFTDPNYFTTCFKKEFGENPSQIGQNQ